MTEEKGQENAGKIVEAEQAQAMGRKAREWAETEKQEILTQEALRHEALRQKALRQEILRQGLLKSELEYEQARAASKRLEKERKRRKIGMSLILFGIGSFILFFLLLGIFDNMAGYALGLFPLACIIAGTWIWSWNKPKY